MRKILVLVIVALFAFNSTKAQTAKGDQNLGINLGFSYIENNNFVIQPSDGSSSQQDLKITSFNAGPNYSYFIADKLDVGVALTYATSTNKYSSNPDPENETGKNYGGTIYIRKYFMYKDKIGIRMGPYLGYNQLNEKVTYAGSYAIYDANDKSDNYQAGFNADLVYYPLKSLGVAASLASLEYDHMKENDATEGHSNGDSVYFNFINNGLNLSVFYVFGGK